MSFVICEYETFIQHVRDKNYQQIDTILRRFSLFSKPGAPVVSLEFPDDLFNQLIRDDQVSTVLFLIGSNVSIYKCTVDTFNWLVQNNMVTMLRKLTIKNYPASACTKTNFDNVQNKFVLNCLIEEGYPLDDLTVEDFNKLVIIGLSDRSLALLLKKFSIHSVTRETFDRLIEESINNQMVYGIKILLNAGYLPERCSLEQYYRCLFYESNVGDCPVSTLLHERGCTSQKIELLDAKIKRLEAEKKCIVLGSAVRTTRQLNMYTVYSILQFMGPFTLKQSGNTAERIVFKKFL